ncbi:hypothetical protein Lsai_3152 [Legionella sainthelensi]|uniref:SidE mono-ADP-ribosyltransferase domain-containing protein n=3 Tax=Legionella sainthelensi TaxID=28087 RepID=A0A0W0YBL4_9GAMM|nr:hypothetical protein Lsai_3152 [Legionella sainthelensi]VEH30591.1 Homologous to SidE substrate of Dot/Icm secretion system [Legionella sainthelensi]
MGISSEEIKKDLEKLISSKFTLPPKQFAQEELAVKQTMQKLLHVLAQPAEQHHMLSRISVESIENMTRRGQLTVIAKNLDDNFLRSVANMMKNTKIEFKQDREKIRISELYAGCKNTLMKAKGSEPTFGDVLLRMYTEDTPFFKKINAIVGGYNDPKTTTDDERKMAFLLNVAIHKAGLDKRKLEVQQTPDELLRGQSFGLDNALKKFEKVKELQAQDKLATLSPEELVEINIVDIAAKKILSTTTNIDVTAKFAKSNGVILHIKNPERLADYYNVANISRFEKEEEFISRIPDDIAMVPISITKDAKGMNHIEVVCIHSENVLLHNSTRLNDIRNSLINYIKNEIEKNDETPPSRHLNAIKKLRDKHNFNRNQLDSMEKLITIINDSEKTAMFDSEKQNEFLEKAFLTLQELYKTQLNRAHPKPYQKERIDAINIMLHDYAAVVADLKVVHENRNPIEIIAQEKERLEANIDGKRRWMASITPEDQSIIAPIKKDLDKLINPASSPADIRAAANNILGFITPEIENKFPTLQENMKDVIGSLNKIEQFEDKKSSQEKTPPSVNFKLELQKSKEQSYVNEIVEEDVSRTNVMANF